MFILLLSAKITLFIFRHSFVHCSFAWVAYTVYSSSFLRSLFICLSAYTVYPSSFLRSLFICPCGSHRLLFLLASNNLQFATLFPSSKNFSHFISHLLIFKFANSTYPCTTLYLLSFTFYLLPFIFYLLPFNPFINH